MSRRLSLPAEHGGYLTAAAAGVAAALVAPMPARALAVGTAVLATFLARGVIERLAMGKPPAAWDRPWLALLALVALVASASLVRRDAALTGGACVGLLVASVVARRTRHHRDASFEALGMGLLGASAGWAAFAAGASARDAATVAVVLATHAALAVPLVRTQLRRRERAAASRAVLIAAAGLVLAAVATLVLGNPLAALALAPRALQAGVHAARAADAPHPSAATVGVRETVELVAAVVLLAVLL